MDIFLASLLCISIIFLIYLFTKCKNLSKKIKELTEDNEKLLQENMGLKITYDAKEKWDKAEIYSLNNKTTELLGKAENLNNVATTLLNQRIFFDEHALALLEKNAASEGWSFKKLYDGITECRLANAFESNLEIKDFKLNISATFVPKSDKIAEKYETSLKSCTCKDHQIHKNFACKHMLFLAYTLGLLRFDKKEYKRTFDELNEKAKEVKNLKSNSKNTT